jgi:hypothetical protein
VALLEGLAGGLEQRGVREKELKASLEKVGSVVCLFDLGRDVACMSNGCFAASAACIISLEKGKPHMFKVALMSDRVN